MLDSKCLDYKLARYYSLTKPILTYCLNRRQPNILFTAVANSVI